MSNDEDPSPPSSQVAPNAIRGDDARALTVQVADPAAANSRPLIAALDAYLVQLYPPASNHLLSIAELQQPNVTFLTAEVGGRIAGCGAYVNHHGEYAEIKRMFILPEFRGEQLGHCILAELESLARAAGLKLARLEAGVSQPAALRLYEQAGYQRRGRFGDYPDDPLSVFMEKSLHRGAQAAVASQPMGAASSPAASSPVVPTLRWVGELPGRLRLIDQTLLPLEFKEIDCRTVEDVWEAIRHLRVRGAPAIGIAAAYGVCLGLQTAAAGDEAGFFARLDEVASRLASSRPTAVNLFWALERMKRVASGLRSVKAPREIVPRLLAEAHAICEEDRQMCRAIGRHGATLLADGQGVLTHCNAGGLATADYGTALAVFFAAHEQGKRLHVYADETRPLLQGARLTAWELAQHGLDVTLICDAMAAQVMREGRVQAVVVGADRIAANGDTANKIGTYQVALAAAAHSIPFYVAAPSSTFDRSLASGGAIPIEERPAEEITHGFGRQTAPDGIKVYNPAFDVTPARLIAAIICERGVIQPVNAEQIAATLDEH